MKSFIKKIGSFVALCLFRCHTELQEITPVSEITNRRDLIGGPGALGEAVTIAENDVPVVIQSGKYSRGLVFMVA